MTIQYASDLHLEFGANTSYLRKHTLLPSGDILILAGDIGYLGNDAFIKHPFWDWASNHFQRVIAIPGNHELYGGFDMSELHCGWELFIRDNVIYTYNSVVHLDNSTDLIASTLWGEISPINALITQRRVSDFYYIKDRGVTINYERFNDENAKCKTFIKDAAAKSKADNVIVVTHHVPSYALIDSKFIDSPINGAFTSEMGVFIAESRIKYWIYGHSHCNISKHIGNASCVCNQLGYVQAAEHIHFKNNAIIKI